MLQDGGHQVVGISPSRGVDVVSGDGLEEALSGVECIVDAASGPSPEQEAARRFFTTSRRLQRGEDRPRAAALADPVPVSILRAALADMALHREVAPAPVDGAPIPEIAGPREESLIEAAMILVARRGDPVRIEAMSNRRIPTATCI